jgi:asparagine synthase (glutamine-hydrolysing)
MQLWNKNRNSAIRPLLIKKLYPHLRHFSNPRHFGLMKIFYEGFLDSFQNNLAGLNIRLYNNQVLLNYFNKDTFLPLSSEQVLESINTSLPQEYSSWSLFQKNQFLEMRTLLSGYLLSSQGDRMSMSHGVEARYPFLDHRLVERLFAINDTYKLNGFSQKHLLKEAFKRHLPASIVNRPKMPYQAPDVKSFFRSGNLTDNAAEFLSPEKIKEYGLFDPVTVSGFLAKSCANSKDKIGYRDNMLITFILSAQICCYWIKNPKISTLDEKIKTVDVNDDKG